MSKVLFRHLNNGEGEIRLACPICNHFDSFSHDKIAIRKKREREDSREYPEGYELADTYEDEIDSFKCSCGWVMLFDATGKVITEKWDENHAGDFIVINW